MTQLRERAEDLESNTNDTTTNSTRKTQNRKYLEFCEQFSYDPLHLMPDQSIMYVAYPSFFLVFSSISNYVSGLSHFLKSNGQPGVDYANFKIKQVLRGSEGNAPRDVGKHQPFCLMT